MLWPPEDEAEESERKAMVPSFPFELIGAKEQPEFIARYEALLQKKADALAAKDNSPSLDDLLAEADGKVEAATGNGISVAVAEAREEINKIDVKASLYKRSEYREQLAQPVSYTHLRAHET